MMELTLFIVTLTCTVTIAFNLFVVELSDSLDVESLCALLSLFTLTSASFIYFYASERLTRDLLEVGDVFYNSAWYRLPAKQQLLLKLVTIRAQRDVRLKSLGLIDCSLPVFASVRMHMHWIARFKAVG